MTVDTQTLLSMDRRWAQLGIDPERAGILQAEVDRLAEAIETVRQRLRFDTEPAGFHRVVDTDMRRTGQ